MGTQPYWDWTLGIISACHLHIAELISFMTDASNFQNSTFWDPDSASGVGGWGDPNDDNQITDGGFADFLVSYPSPHRIRRLYTPMFPGRPDELSTNEFTPESQVAMVNDFEGNFIGFQTRFESGSHAAVHSIVGGCAKLLNALWFRPLTDPTQRSCWDLSIDRSCWLLIWP